MWSGRDTDCGKIPPMQEDISQPLMWSEAWQAMPPFYSGVWSSVSTTVMPSEEPSKGGSGFTQIGCPSIPFLNVKISHDKALGWPLMALVTLRLNGMLDRVER